VLSKHIRIVESSGLLSAMQQQTLGSPRFPPTEKHRAFAQASLDSRGIFLLRKAVYYISKGCLPHFERLSTTFRKAVYHISKGCLLQTCRLGTSNHNSKRAFAACHHPANDVDAMPRSESLPCPFHGAVGCAGQACNTKNPKARYPHLVSTTGPEF